MPTPWPSLKYTRRMIMAQQSKAELDYLRFIQDYKEQVFYAHPDAVQEGFEYFASKEYSSKYPENKMSPKKLLFGQGWSHFRTMAGIFARYMIPMMKGMKQGFTDVNPYLEELRENNQLTNTHELLDSYPNPSVWDDLKNYSWEKWQLIVGFTEMPRQFVFKGKATLFKYALVFIQEMDKEQIDYAPGLEAGAEVQRVYQTLGLAVNDIACFLRAKYRIKCQSNHPLGGLVNTNPLAGKAGLGGQGHDGMLITPQFGQRNRIAPIFIENKIFEYTDNDDHRWVEQYCKTCKKCMRKCPTGAIYEEKIPTLKNIPGIGQTRTCIDRNKCFPQFMNTLGCSMCIQTCPFSQGKDAYDRIKTGFDKRNAGVKP